MADTRYVIMEEAVAEFLHTIAHNVRNRTNSFRLGRSGETISHHFYRVLTAVALLSPDIIKQARINTDGIPYFEVLIMKGESCQTIQILCLMIVTLFRNVLASLIELMFQYMSHWPLKDPCEIGKAL